MNTALLCLRIVLSFIDPGSVGGKGSKSIILVKNTLEIHAAACKLESQYNSGEPILDSLLRGQ